MTKTIIVDGKEVKLRASAAIPRLYRIKFRRDIMQDMQEIQTEMDKQGDGGSKALPAKMLQVFEDVAYLMARHADPEHVPDTPEEWLDQFETFSIYEVFPEIVDLWALNMETTATPKKK